MVRYFLFSQSWALGWLLMLSWQAAPAIAHDAEPLPAVARDDEIAFQKSHNQVARPLHPMTSSVSGDATAAKLGGDCIDERCNSAIAPPITDKASHPVLPQQTLSQLTRSEPLPTGSYDQLETRAAPIISSRQAQRVADEFDLDPHPHKPKKQPKSVAPLLTQFIASSETPSTQPIAASPPDPQPATPSDKPASPPVNSPALPSDPELGVIQVAEVRRDDELGVIQLRNPLQDPELGILELRQISPPPRRNPWLFLSAFVTASSSDNVFLVEDPVRGRFGDNFIRPGVSLTAFPAIGPQTNLLVSARTSLLRYEEQSNSSYDELRFQAGVRHQFSERVYGQFSLSRQLLFDEGYEDRFFTNTGIEVTVGRRDSLTPQLTLDSYYQGQIFFSDPERFSNVLNSIGAYLGYRITKQWDTGVSYRLTISDFTQQSRDETYQRITGQLRYAITPAMRLSVFGGVSYGRSSASRITFDDTFFGISFDATVSIF